MATCFVPKRCLTHVARRHPPTQHCRISTRLPNLSSQAYVCHAEEPHTPGGRHTSVATVAIFHDERCATASSLGNSEPPRRRTLVRLWVAVQQDRDSDGWLSPKVAMHESCIPFMHRDRAADSLHHVLYGLCTAIYIAYENIAHRSQY